MCFHNPSPHTSLQLFLTYGSTEGFWCMCGPLCRTLSLVTVAGFPKKYISCRCSPAHLCFVHICSHGFIQRFPGWRNLVPVQIEDRLMNEQGDSGDSADAAWITFWISPSDVHRSGCHPLWVLQKHVLKITDHQMTPGARLDIWKSDLGADAEWQKLKAVRFTGESWQVSALGTPGWLCAPKLWPLCAFLSIQQKMRANSWLKTLPKLSQLF